MVNTVAKCLGAILLLVGIGSLFFGANSVNGLLSARPEEITMHFFTGGVLVLAGIARSRTAPLIAIAIINPIFLALAITYFAFPGSSMAEASPLHEVMRLVIGLIGLATVLVRVVVGRSRESLELK